MWTNERCDLAHPADIYKETKAHVACN